MIFAMFVIVFILIHLNVEFHDESFARCQIAQNKTDFGVVNGKVRAVDFDAAANKCRAVWNGVFEYQIAFFSVADVCNHNRIVQVFALDGKRFIHAFDDVYFVGNDVERKDVGVFGVFHVASCRVVHDVIQRRKMGYGRSAR